MASFLVSALMKQCTNPVMYFYCKHDQPNKRTLKGVLRGILAQLLKSDEDLLDYVYETCAAADETKLQSERTLEELFTLAVAGQRITFLVLDGLDECETQEEYKIVSWLQSAALDSTKSPGSGGRFRLLCVSQRDGCMEDLMSDFPSLSLDGDQHKEDISKFVKQMASEIRTRFQLEQDKETEIVSNVVSRSAGERTTAIEVRREKITLTMAGMFLYARIVLENLLQQTSRARLWKELHPDTFPRDLKQAYAYSGTILSDELSTDLSSGM